MRTTLITLLVTAGLALAGCGSSTVSSAETKPYSAADITFATQMIPHHAQAMTMVDLTRGRTLDPAVRKLTDDITMAQTPEIETMAGWLEGWGKKVPETGRGHDMAGMDHGAASMPGMMSDQQMSDLGDASDADFQRLWLQMMEQHHRGAVTMARTEIKDGRYPKAIALARSIVTGQTAEIATIERLLSR